MIRAVLAATAWGGLYVALVLGGIWLFLLGPVPPNRGFWIEFGVLLGFAGLVILALQFALTARFPWIAPPFGVDTVLQFHRQIGILCLLVIFAHPVILFLSDPRYLAFLDPRVNFLRALFLILATIALILLVVLPLWRVSFRLSYEWWRITHALLAAGVIVVGMAHAWQVGHYVDGWTKRGLLVALGGAALALVVYVRIVKPWRMLKEPYQVVHVRDEHGDSSTVILEPVGHKGMQFRGGQYAWITLGSTPFKLQQNPFSFSVSDQAAPERIEFTAKPSGDFTSQLRAVEPGSRAFLEGPYGTFCVEDDSPGAVFIMGGIGITPAMSMLRSLRDTRDRRPLRLIYGNVGWEEVVFREELERLQQSLDLQVVHVLSEPHEGWTGETGFLTRELLERHITPAERQFQFFVCGPEPMMDLVEKALLQMGIPLHQTRSERFNIV